MSSSKGSEFPIVLVKNLPFNSRIDSLYALFGQHGSIYQLRVADKSTDSSQAGTCYVIYHNVSSAVSASSKLNGVNFEGRYLVTSLYSVDKSKLSEEDFIQRQKHLDELKQEYGIE